MCAFLFLLALLAALPSTAGPWTGDSRTIDGVVHVSNPAAPMMEPSVVRPKEMWRIGGETANDEEMFGVVTRVVADTEGSVYVLDRQLSEVRVFNREGLYVRTIGREGEGPGEFRRPSDMFFSAPRELAVLQVFPPRIVLLSVDGVPTGNLPFPEHDGPQMLRRAIPAGENIALVRRIQEFKDDSFAIHATIDLMDRQGTVLATLESHTFQMNFASFKLREQDFDLFQRRLAVGRDGRIYTCPKRQGYVIHVWSPDGKLLSVIERDYETYKRSNEEREKIQRLWDTYGRTNSNASAEVDDYDKDIRKVYPRADGSIWVLTSHGVRSRPAGSLGIFDVFDAQGRFVQQLILMGEGDPLEDSYYFDADRLFVATKIVQSDAASRGGMEREDEDDGVEPTPTELICYELTANIALKQK